MTDGGRPPQSEALLEKVGRAQRSDARMRVHLWLPGIFGVRGGIEVFSGQLLDGLRDRLPEAHFDVSLKNDPPAALPPVRPARTTFHATGGVPRRLRTAIFAAGIAIRALLARPDLIIVGHLHFAPLARCLRRIGIPYWVVVHGVEAWNITRPTLKAAAKNADTLLSVSGYTRDRMIREEGLDPERVVILPNTVDPATFNPGPRPEFLLTRHSLRPDQPVLLTVARLAGKARDKGYDRILDSLARIRESAPDVRYIIVGSGLDRPRVVARIEELGLGQSVTLAGFIPDNELPDYYRLCDLFAMPSRCEGFGIVYLEAMASGKPAIGGNQDGAVDALDGGELGILVDPDDSEDLARNVVAVLAGNHPHALAGNPEELHRRVVTRFGPEAFRAALGKILRERLP